MATDIEICNGALIRLGAEAIQGFEDTTVEGRLCKQLYPRIRDSYLASFPWSFARVQEQLDLVSTEPVTIYSRRHTIPPEMIRLLRVHNGNVDVPFKRHTDEDNKQYLYSDADKLFVDYIRRVSEAIFPEYFQEALEWKLAAEFCLTLTENSTRTQLAEAKFDRANRNARIADLQQQTHVLDTSFFIRDR